VRLEDETPTRSKARAKGVARLSDDPARAKEIRKEQREALVAGVACHLEGDAWNSCQFSTKAVMPTIQKLRNACKRSVKCGWEKLSKTRQRAIYEDWTEKTVMEVCDGTMPAVDFRVGGAAHGLLGLEAAAGLFRSEVLTWRLGIGSNNFPSGSLWKDFV
jgi:hypothetical protein